MPNYFSSMRVLHLFLSILVLVGRPLVCFGQLTLTTTHQIPVDGFPERFHRIETQEQWEPSEVAIIVCDVWDSHHCVNAVRRVQELAPRIDALAKWMRGQGATIIHAPSDCMPFYETHPARNRAKSVPVAANLPKDLNRWCDSIPSEEGASYPVDQSDGGEDDNSIEHEQWAKTLAAEGRNPKLPWRQQIPAIEIDSAKDYVSDSGNEVWNILENHRIKHVLLCGVHTNMCVLGRPFGLRQLSSHGKHAVLLRDLTDTMYNPLQWPYVNHFSGTDLVIDHVERYVCPTTTSDHLFASSTNKVDVQFLTPHKFMRDRRPHLAILIAEDEYETARTLPAFAASHLHSELRTTFVYGDLKNPGEIPGLKAIEKAGALLISVRRRPLKPEDLACISNFVRSGKPIIGIRTASHAFCLRDGRQIEGLVQWPEFDAYAFGGNYTNHHPNELESAIYPKDHQNTLMVSKGSLYQVSPIGPGTHLLWRGRIDGKPEEPVAWSNIRADGGYSFYTSLGHKSDFDEPAFRSFLAQAILEACGVQPPSSATMESNRDRYLKGKGKQRK